MVSYRLTLYCYYLGILTLFHGPSVICIFNCTCIIMSFGCNNKNFSIVYILKYFVFGILDKLLSYGDNLR